MLRVIALLILAGVGCFSENSGAVWRWECKENVCVKLPISGDNAFAVSLGACRLFCGVGGGLWPRPTGVINVGNTICKIDPTTIELKLATKIEESVKAKQLLENVIKRFTNQLLNKVPKQIIINNGGKKLQIFVNIEDIAELSITLSTDESYSLKIEEIDENVSATITAKTYFGARHGIETLSQLVILDDIRLELQVANNVNIDDKPVYPYRGILLDTGRNYFSVDSIKRTIDAMATTKLNTFHWHITDSQSFPFQSKSREQLYLKGAYKPYLIYTIKDMEEIVEFALIRGVRVMPEFDAPAHVGEGWQDFGMLACFNYQPWSKYCVEPPCGQLDPTNDDLYDVLEDIYKDMFEIFQPDLFHMGGDEVSTACWNSSTEIQNWMKTKGWDLKDDDFMKLWGYFQDEALKRVNKIAGKDIPIIVWTSRLTELAQVTKYLPKDKYIIQVWTTAEDVQIHDLLTNGYKLIISNYDALYLDCGFGGWVTDGNNWCSPYIGWQKVYENSPEVITTGYKDQVLGGEAAIWSEQIDEHSLDARIWPRAAALGERLWAEPHSSWHAAQYRLLTHRERLLEQGIHAESIQPQWCLQNEGDCPLHK